MWYPLQLVVLAATCRSYQTVGSNIGRDVTLVLALDPIFPFLLKKWSGQVGLCWLQSFDMNFGDLHCPFEDDNEEEEEEELLLMVVVAASLLKPQQASCLQRSQIQ